MTTADPIVAALVAHGRLAVEAYALHDEDDLYAAGMTSHASVNVMLALEETFDVEFPPELLTKSTFRSLGSIREALSTLGVAG